MHLSLYCGTHFSISDFSWPHPELLGEWSKHYYWAKKKKYLESLFPQVTFRLTINVICFPCVWHIVSVRRQGKSPVERCFISCFWFNFFFFFIKDTIYSLEPFHFTWVFNVLFQKYNVFFFLLSNMLYRFPFSSLGSLFLAFLLKQPLTPSSQYPGVSVSYCQVQEMV